MDLKQIEFLRQIYELIQGPIKRVYRFLRRRFRHARSLKSDGTSLCIGVADIKGDRNGQLARRLVRHLESAFGIADGLIDVYQDPVSFLFADVGFSRTDSARLRDLAARRMDEVGADILLVGEADEDAISIRVYTRQANHSLAPSTFRFDESFRLPREFDDKLSAALLSEILIMIAPIVNTGTYVAKAAERLSKKLQPLCESIPAGLNAYKGELLYAYGLCFAVIGEQTGDIRHLLMAIKVFDSALKEFTRDRFPLSWAMTKNGLGNVLFLLGERGDNGALKKAVEAYEDALKERTREKVPLDWASTKNNLGNALSMLGERGNDDALKKAVEAYEDALKEYSREKVPLNWAMTKNNLGNAFLTLGERGDNNALEKAVVAYEDALKVYTQERGPLDWAVTKNNLGNALSALGERGDNDALKKAVEAYEDALKEYTRERLPLNWAMTKNNLGNAFSKMGRCGNNDALNNAVEAYEDALQERTREKTPLDWAITKNNFGNALLLLDGCGDDDALKRAIEAYEDALVIFRKFNLSNYTSTTERSLSNALKILAERT